MLGSPLIAKNPKNGKKNVTRKELANSVYEKLDILQRNGAEIVDAVFAAMKDTLVDGESIKLVQFGTLNVQKNNRAVAVIPAPGNP